MRTRKQGDLNSLALNLNTLGTLDLSDAQTVWLGRSKVAVEVSDECESDTGVASTG